MRSVLAQGTIIAILGTALIGTASATPVEVIFAPPPIETSCVIPPEVETVAAKWEQWDRKALPDPSVDQVMAEIQQLRDHDAPRFLEPATAAFALLQQSGDAGVQQKVLVEQIRYLVAAGRAADVAAQGLVQQLETSFMTLAPRSLYALARAYLDGEGAAVDQAKGEGYLLAAAAGGNSDALLRAAQMRSDGGLALYGLDPKTAVTLALGGILGDVDPAICSRINRIARYYEAGEVVKQSYVLAERWLRLSADLGDPSAAWKVARYHLSSEYIVKDNAVLIKYLTMAADADNVQAQVELGEIYQAGSLVDQDREKAETLYRQAASSGNQIGYLRLIALLEAYKAEPGVAERLEQALRELAAQPDAPAQALVKLADLLIRKEGRWAARGEVQSLLERAVELKSPEAALVLADYVLTAPGREGAIDRAMSLLNFAVSEGGKSEAMSRLAEIYMCQVPDAPNVALAANWTERALAAGNGASLQGAPGTDATADIDLAQAQSIALRGASGGIAEYVEMLRKADYGEEVLAFWEARMKQDPDAQNSLARILMESDPTSQGVELSVRLLESAVDAGSDAARVTLANLLIGQHRNDPATEERAVDLLNQAALHGLGAAIMRLTELQSLAGDVASPLGQYLPAIDARGDLDAFIYAAAMSTDPVEQRRYLAQAAGMTSCSFSEVIKLARAYGAISDGAMAEHWLDIATKLIDGRGWQYASLAQEYAKLGDQHTDTVVALLEEAVAHGQISSLDRLIEIRADAGSPAYDPDRVVALVKQAVTTANPAQLLNLARRIERAQPGLRNRLAEAVDILAIYRGSAEGGNATAMRELAKLLQHQANGPDQLREAMDWMEKAADAHDADAMVLLAKAYAVGLGRDVSLDRAKVLLMAASQLGNTDADEMLGAIDALKAQQ